MQKFLWCSTEEFNAVDTRLWTNGGNVNQFQYTIFGLLIMSIALITVILFDLDLFEKLVLILELIESYEIDEVIIFVVLFVPFVVVDIVRHSIKQKIEHAQLLEKEKNKIYSAMVSASQQILNNFLNNIQYFKLRAQNTPGFSSALTKQCDEVMEAASTQISSLSQLNDINEQSIYNAINLPPGNNDTPTNDQPSMRKIREQDL